MDSKFSQGVHQKEEMLVLGVRWLEMSMMSELEIASIVEFSSLKGLFVKLSCYVTAVAENKNASLSLL